MLLDEGIDHRDGLLVVALLGEAAGLGLDALDVVELEGAEGGPARLDAAAQPGTLGAEVVDDGAGLVILVVVGQGAGLDHGLLAQGVGLGLDVGLRRLDLARPGRVAVLAEVRVADRDALEVLALARQRPGSLV